MRRREISVCRQTWALFCKNLLKKWRLKRESLMEWLGSLLLLLVLYLYPTSHEIHDFSSMPTINLGRVDSLNLSFNVIYTPFTSTTQQIMKKVASASIMNGREVFGVPNEKMIEEFKANYSLEIVSVIFTNDFSYDLNFFRGLYGVAHKEHKDRTAHCYETYFGNVDCGVTALWKSGFVALQAAINAAIIEVTTNHSVMKELMSATGQNMKIHRFVRQGGFVTDFCLFFLILSFSPFAYYACVNVTRERGETKASMATMGLRASAF